MKKIFYEKSNQKRAGMTTLTSDKIDFNSKAFTSVYKSWFGSVDRVSPQTEGLILVKAQFLPHMWRATN